MARPMVKFLAQETASGVLLLVATAAALVWRNGPWGETYHAFWDTHLALSIGSHQLLDLSLHGWVNDALMALFFFVVGMEIKSELVAGDLADRRVAALPAFGALGGMVVPALLFLGFNYGTDSSTGWGIPMATDIAFAVGVLAIFGPRVPQRLRLFLLTLAIVDDIGAILVIAIFYTTAISFGWLAIAGGLIVVIVALRPLRVWYQPVYVLLGTGVWFAMHESGVHATIAGVVLGLLAPARPLLGQRAFEHVEDILAGDTADPAAVRDASFRIREMVPVTGRLTALLSPWTSFLIIPTFALANAGVQLSGDAASGALTSRVTWGVVVGLVIGKPVGIYLFSTAAIRANVATLPEGLRPAHLLGAGAVAGIGFTVALFISTLAFDDPRFTEESIIGILMASVLATFLGWFVLRSIDRGRPAEADEGVLVGT
ncbi:MAG: Na+/H+ antiporter NhaA [Acidimicrobiales bacterium]